MAILNRLVYEVPFNPVCGHFCNQSYDKLASIFSSSEPPVIYRLYTK